MHSSRIRAGVVRHRSNPKNIIQNKMEKDKPYLTLVDPATPAYEAEFAPLPYYPWDERPPSLPLDVDETATAIHLAQNLPAAAQLLKVPLIRLTRLIRAHPRLQRVLEETTELVVHHAAAEYVQALASSSDRRREWGAAQIMRSRAAQSHPLAPAPANASTSVSISESREITFTWRRPVEPDTLDHADEGRRGADDPDVA